MEPALKEFIRDKAKGKANVNTTIDLFSKLINTVGAESAFGAALSAIGNSYFADESVKVRKNSGPRRGLLVAFAIENKVFIGYSLCNKRDSFSDDDALRHAMGNALLGGDCHTAKVKKNSPVEVYSNKAGDTVMVHRKDHTPAPEGTFFIPMSILNQLKEFIARARKYYNNPKHDGPKKVFPAWTEIM